MSYFEDNPPSGAKAPLHLTADSARLKRLRKKSEWGANSAKDRLAGAKAQLILLTLSAWLKPCPCYKAPSVEFFRNL
jgi:hypothetical protein